MHWLKHLHKTTCICTTWVILKKSQSSQFGLQSVAVSHCSTQSGILPCLINTPKEEEVIFPVTSILHTCSWQVTKSISWTSLSFMDLLLQLEQTALLIISAFLPEIVLCQSTMHETKVEFYRQLLWELREEREHTLHVFLAPCLQTQNFTCCQLTPEVYSSASPPWAEVLAVLIPKFPFPSSC